MAEEECVITLGDKIKLALFVIGCFAFAGFCMIK